MNRKLFVIVFCALLHNSCSSRMRFDQSFNEQIYHRNDHFRNDGGMHGEPVFKREHFYPREAVLQAEQMMPQPGLMRAEPMYGNDPMPLPPPPPPPQPQNFPNDGFIQNTQMMGTDSHARAESFIRAEPILRREPMIRREPFIRAEPILRNERIFQNPPVVREEPIFRSQPNTYAVMLTQCSCDGPSQNFGQISSQTGPQMGQQIGSCSQLGSSIGHELGPQMGSQLGPQETFIPIQQQPIVSHRIVCQKPMLKPHIYQPVVTFPRIQRIVRKGFRSLPDTIQLSPPPMPSPPEFNTFNSEQVQFQANFQNQSPPETTSEPSQVNPVTARNTPQVPTPLNLAQMSSIC